MYVLQAAMAGGMAIAALIGLGLLIGIPVLTCVFWLYFSRKQGDSTTYNEVGLDSTASQTEPTQKGHFLKSCALAVLFTIILLIVGIAILTTVVRDVE